MTKQLCGANGVHGVLAQWPVGRAAEQDVGHVTDLLPRFSVQDDLWRSKSVEIHVQVLCITKHTISKNPWIFFFIQWNQNTHFIFTEACKRVCPGGRPSKGCSYCICDGQRLHGEVLSVTGVPVPNATVALASQTKVVRAHTDAKGQFKIDGLCTSPQTQVVIRKDKFAPITLPVSNNSTNELWVRAILRSSGKEKKKPLDMDDSTLIISCSYIVGFYILCLTEKPYIEKHPEDKVRYEGQRATLCCRATGSPKPDKYYW